MHSIGNFLCALVFVMKSLFQKNEWEKKLWKFDYYYYYYYWLFVGLAF